MLCNRAVSSRCRAQRKTQAQGPSKQWSYDVIMLRPFDEDILAKWVYAYRKRRQNYWSWSVCTW